MEHLPLCAVRTHHNALRLSSVSHQTMGLAQASSPQLSQLEFGAHRDYNYN